MDTKLVSIFIAHKNNEADHHCVMGSKTDLLPDGSINLDQAGVNIATGKPDKLTMRQRYQKEIEHLLRTGSEIEHTGVFGPEGGIETVDWSADYEQVERIGFDGKPYSTWDYAEWHKDRNKVRGTLIRTIYFPKTQEEIIVSSKKTFRHDS